MSLTTQHLIALKSLKGYGNAKVRLLADLLHELPVEADDQFHSLLNGFIRRGAIKGIRPENTVTAEAMYAALKYADSILTRSDSMGIRVLSYLDVAYPKRFRAMIDAGSTVDVPLVIYCKGNLDVLDSRSIAIIGTREPTPEGLKAGEYYGTLFAGEGYNIVSGLALGCDAAAHRGAIVSGVTTAVLAHGLDTLYPPENKELAQWILEKGGLLLSEYPVGEKVDRYKLVARDRIQALLADVTLVIQTGETGGTHQAANATLTMGRPLFCVQYKNLGEDHPKTLGNALFVRQGAHYLHSATAKETVASALDKQTISGLL